MTQPWGQGYALVLGCSSGVGAAITKALAGAGYGILGFHRGHHSDEADALELACAATVPTRFFTLDAGTHPDTISAEQARHCVTAAIRPGELRVLVHSLSGASIGNTLTLTPVQIERTFNNLAHSFLWWIQWLHERNLFATDGVALALSNPCPDFYLRDSGVIGAAKAALEAYVRMLAIELRGAPRVNCLRFATVRTPALEAVMPAAIPQLEALHRHIVPRGRMQTTDDVANLVAMLVSKPAWWLNGAIIDGTGGAPTMLMDYAFHGARQVST